MQNHNQYTFRVRRDATKTDIRKAVELMFDVKVAGVQVVNEPGKVRRFGKIAGRTQDWKKAYVRSEEHTSELQSQSNLVCRLLLEKKKKNKSSTQTHSSTSA